MKYFRLRFSLTRLQLDLYQNILDIRIKKYNFTEIACADCSGFCVYNAYKLKL